jgi:GH15 family glucan-1,4-alpha-glucosidase
MPRFDSDPVFSTLMDHEEGGHCTVAPAEGGLGTQRYLENTNVLETRFETSNGSFRVLDFAPRFEQFSRMFRPTMLVRILEPLDGAPWVTATCDPKIGWTKVAPAQVAGSNHIDYEGFTSRLRLTTDIPLSYMGKRPFALTERRYLVVTWGAPVEESLPTLCNRFFGETVRYWEGWIRRCSIPALYQREVIRSALALKLHCFEDTGAIVAAMTTSIPEAPQSGRTWDYRYCWLRDAYYALGAFRLLGHFEERESFINYLLSIAGAAQDLNLSPLYRVDGSSDLDEEILPHWRGYENDGPVRIGNGAANHAQHDIYGEMVLAISPVFFDERFLLERSKSTLELLERLARRAIAVVGTPDAGIWEYRTEWQPQTFSSLMCWAAADRMAKVAALQAPSLEATFRDAAVRIRNEIVEKAWNPSLNTFTGSYGGRELDASLLQMAPLRVLAPDDPKLNATIDALWKGLSKDGWLFRYQLDDGFGHPTVAFTICTFWLVEALVATGRPVDARAVMEQIHTPLSPLGLLSEDYEPATLRMWGNFPQAYSHVGLIRGAFAASPNWAEVL